MIGAWHEPGDVEGRRCNKCGGYFGARVVDAGPVMTNTRCKRTDGCRGRTFAVAKVPEFCTHQWQRATEEQLTVWEGTGYLVEWATAGGLILVPIPEESTEESTEEKAETDDI